MTIVHVRWSVNRVNIPCSLTAWHINEAVKTYEVAFLINACFIKGANVNMSAHLIQVSYRVESTANHPS